MNAALIKKYIPAGVPGYHVRVPQGSTKMLGHYIAKKFEDKSTHR